MLDIVSESEKELTYFTFWATWCSPCLEELQYFEELYSNVDTSNVEFVFLAHRSPEYLWTEKIKEFNLKGRHYLLTQNQHNALADILEFSGILHLSLIHI